MEISKNAVVTVTIDCLFVPSPAIWPSLDEKIADLEMPSESRKNKIRDEKHRKEKSWEFYGRIFPIT